MNSKSFRDFGGFEQGALGQPLHVSFLIRRNHIIAGSSLHNVQVEPHINHARTDDNGRRMRRGEGGAEQVETAPAGQIILAEDKVDGLRSQQAPGFSQVCARYRLQTAFGDDPAQTVAIVIVSDGNQRPAADGASAGIGGDFERVHCLPFLPATGLTGGAE